MAEEEFLLWEDEEARLWLAEVEFLVWVAEEEFLFWVAEEVFRVCVAAEEFLVWVAEEVFLVWVADLESFPEPLWTVADDEEPPRDEEDAEELRVAVPEEFLCWVELL